MTGQIRWAVYGGIAIAAGIVLLLRHKQVPGIRVWLAQLLVRAHQNVVIVALANKLVRMAWAILCKNERYRAPVLVAAA
jgi:transposase